MKVLSELFYSEDHEWVRIEGNTAYVGITDYAQHALGDIVYVDLPEIGAEFESGDAFGAVESVKSASDTLTPMSGKVVEVNEALVDNPALLNEDPYENWMMRIELFNKDEVKDLMNAEQYMEFCKEEA